MKTRVAILGGAFDPPTLGHIDAARVVLAAPVGIAEVWLTPVVGHRFGKQMSPPEDRLSMCRLAADDSRDPRIKPCDYEIRHSLPGDTFSLLSRLMADPEYHGRVDFSFVIGQDNAENFHRWHRADELKSLAPFIVLPRQGIEPGSAQLESRERPPWYSTAPHVYLKDQRPVLRTSSTEARAMIASGDPNVASMVSPKVLEFARGKSLYR